MFSGHALEHSYRLIPRACIPNVCYMIWIEKTPTDDNAYP